MKNNIENFDVGKLDSAIKDIGKVGKQVSQFPKQIDQASKKIEKTTTEKFNSLNSKISEQADQVSSQINSLENKINEVTDQVEVLITKKFTAFFTQFGHIMYKGIIKPMEDMFVGIGHIFTQIFYILKKIGDKIVNLPGCMIVYMIKESLNVYFALYNAIVPKFIRKPIKSFYNYTLKYIFYFIGYITGYNSAVKKCYGFNVNNQVGNMENQLKNIDSSFKKNFGKMDFSKLKV